MEPIQGVVIMLVLLGMALAPRLVARALNLDKRDQAPAAAAGELPVVMTPEQTLARHQYGQAYGWGKLDMLEYDKLPFVREPWERSAAAQLERVAR